MKCLAILLALPALAMAQAPEIDVSPLFAAPVTDLTRKTFPLADCRGRTLVVNFWARWCVPCRDEIPQLVALRKKYTDQEISIIGIALDDNAVSVKDFSAAYDINYPVVLMPNTAGVQLMAQLGNAVAGLPYTLVIDRSGRVAYRHTGRFDHAMLVSAIGDALKLPQFGHVGQSCP